MSPSNWTGLIALCAVLGAIGGIWWFGVYAGRMANALEGVEATVKDFRKDFKEASDRTEQEIDLLKHRTTKLESYLDVDGHYTNILEMRRRRNDA